MRVGIVHGVLGASAVKEFAAGSGKQPLRPQPPQKIPLRHAVLEGLMAVDENNRDLVGELAAQRIVGIHVDLAPGKAAPTLEFGQRFLDDLAQVTSPA